jgi:hypothetical protein
MSKIVSQYADQLSHIGIYPVIALILFMAVFAAVLVQVRLMDREDLSELSKLPLDATDEPGIPDEQTH